ncbi:hypothetical protein PGTUg99_005910 [Puccinia graminis f. sp. tritici]|uniref:Uncharacterized protein n=1 Tax=Puccinia graminis f. sp. tritici TaxID=56615 RepID=A0A5B0RI37_PUCGR|nr:hypothetical protein PGTUg99_005910 [Puccinia graminis f. sp. tritici]
MTLNENGGLDRPALSSHRSTKLPIYSSSTHPATLTAPSSYQQSPKSSATHLHSQGSKPPELVPLSG